VLVEGKPGYYGGFCKFGLNDLANWGRLAEVVKIGAPVEDVNVVENPFWEELVLSIAPGSYPLAQAAAARLRIAEAGKISILDVGGGSGVYSAVLLAKNPPATSTQHDLSNVHHVARQF